MTQSGATGDLAVSYTIDATSTATAGADYNALSGSVTIPSGDTTATIQLVPIDAFIVGGSKTVVVDLQGGPCGCCGGGCCGGSSTYTVGSPGSATVTITDDDTNPVTLNNPGDQTNFDGDTANLGVSGSDSDNNQLSYSAGGLPPGLDIDPNSGIISGTITSNADISSPYSASVTATDTVNGASQQVNFNWTVNVNPVTLNGPGDQTNFDGNTVTVGVGGSDADNNPLSYTASGLPPGLSIDPNSGIIFGTIASNADTGSPYYNSVTATDAVNGASQTVNFNWTVNSVTVTLTNPATRQIMMATPST